VTKFLKPIASLRITVTLIVLTIILVFVGTTAQKDMGAWDVQRDYFYAWGVLAPVKYFFPLFQFADNLPSHVRFMRWSVPFAVPLVGGYTIAIAMLINLFAAYITKFKIGWKDLLVIPPLIAFVWLAGNLTYSLGYYALTAALILASAPLIGAAFWLHGKRGGVVLIHLGLLLVLGGELATSVVKVEQSMQIDEGGYANYASDIHHPELVVIDPSDPDHNHVVAIGESKLSPDATISDKNLPFDVKVDAYYPNSNLLGPMQPKPGNLPVATAGAGLSRAVEPADKISGVGSAKADMPSAYVTLVKDGQDLGRYLVSQYLSEQPVVVGDKVYQIALRFRRYYKPFELHLQDFRFDKLTGTETARNFSSLVTLVNKNTGENREVNIWMNHPLRYGGETFYQSSFDDATERTTVLQVVRNPSWLFPYIACVVGGLGMLSHFGWTLREFVRKRNLATAAVPVALPESPATSQKRRKREQPQPIRDPEASPLMAAMRIVVPGGVVALCALYLIIILVPHDASKDGDFDFKPASAIPMSYEGRVMPIDTIARVALKSITGGKDSLRMVEGKPSNMSFFFDMLMNERRVFDYAMVRIDHPEVVGFLGLNPTDAKGAERQYFTLSELEPNIGKLQDEANRAHRVPPNEKSAFDHQIEELAGRIVTVNKLGSLPGLFAMPPKDPTVKGAEWRRLGDVFREQQASGAENPAFMKFTEILRAYHENQPADFNKAVADYQGYLGTVVPKNVDRAGVEVFFNRIAPFYHLMVFYVLAFVLVLLSFLFAGEPLRRAAFAVLVLTVNQHTGGLIFRMYLQGRPPVTTLYSSAIFIAWGGVILALVIEKIFKSRIGLIVAAANGFLSLFIAHNLAGSDGDTLKPLQAVLDTNFWLATHVVMITLGYASTILAGLLAITYVVLGVTTTILDKSFAKDLVRMVYGILCFAMLFSFVGTVLGGIWADQSWGRFWGWDPKENGAILIVLWNAMILHARWAGLAGQRGTVNLAIFGIVVTSWSWFGTNLLGIGLHAYGFMDGTRFWLFLADGLVLGLIVVGNLPLSLWRSGELLEGAPTPPAPKRATGAPNIPLAQPVN
jgi:ABC-type transport system involved in cytochrome c biogenesis permease subunit